jgi:BirA family biotin operon repressor/biotin-[acetyl-CoA-carboxylase] ligase
MSGVTGADPEPSPSRSTSGPPGTRFVEVRHFDELDSTNRYLLDVARHRPIEGLVAVADHQTAGRGRLGRNWEAPAGTNLLVSVLLLPALAADELHLCSAAAGLATVEACWQAAAVEPALKWPNDVTVGGRKLAGILAESLPVAPPSASRSRAVVVGIGLNVSWPPPDDADTAATVPGELRLSATSLLRETGKEVGRQRLLELLLVDLEQRLADLNDDAGRQRLAAAYRHRCGTLGQRVQVALADGDITGVATDITAEGRLAVDVGGSFVTVSAGDVVHLRGGP